LRRIGLFGGTFDPVHNAHLALARAALAALDLDELRWIPAGMPWQKSRVLTPAVHRAAMVALVIADEPRFVLDRCEIEREGPSYTLQTVRLLQAAAQSGSADGATACEWCLLLGQDQYANLHTWQGWPELVQRVTLAVAARGGVPPTPGELLAKVAHRMQVIPMPDTPISSTELRQRLIGGTPALDLAPAWLPASVASYIDHHGLYGATGDPATRKDERS
jgi:nicotinate-nucleotide adenylyltransferase